MSLKKLQQSAGSGVRSNKIEHNLSRLLAVDPEEMKALQEVLKDPSYSARDIATALGELTEEHPSWGLVRVSPRTIADYRQDKK